MHHVLSEVLIRRLHLSLDNAMDVLHAFFIPDIEYSDTVQLASSHISTSKS